MAEPRRREQLSENKATGPGSPEKSSWTERLSFCWGVVTAASHGLSLQSIPLVTCLLAPHNSSLAHLLGLGDLGRQRGSGIIPRRSNHRNSQGGGGQREREREEINFQDRMKLAVFSLKHKNEHCKNYELSRMPEEEPPVGVGQKK